MSDQNTALSDTRFLSSFIVLAAISGLTVGLGKILTTLYAISLGATPFQVGIVSAMESIGMVLVTVPAGFIIARYGARGVYFLSSLGPLLVNIIIPLSGSWIALAAGRGLIGLCIPFRMVSMNSSFLERLKTLGQAKAGWYRGALTGGTAIIGPAAAALLSQRAGIAISFWIVAALFGLMAVFSLSFLPVRDVRSAEEAPGFIAELQLIFANPGVAESCLVEFVSSATNALFGTFIILVAMGLPLLTEQDGIHVLLFQGAISVAMLFLGGSFIQRLATPYAYGISLFLAALALGALGLSGGFAGLAIGAMLLSGGSAIVHLVNVRMLASVPGGKSKIAGLYNLASMTGSSFGAIAGGFASKMVAVQSVFLLWIPLLCAAAFLIALLRRRSAITTSVALGEA